MMEDEVLLHFIFFMSNLGTQLLRPKSCENINILLFEAQKRVLLCCVSVSSLLCSLLSQMSSGYLKLLKHYLTRKISQLTVKVFACTCHSFEVGFVKYAEHM